jgi:bacterioferritin-associated ferredoxin
MIVCSCHAVSDQHVRRLAHAGASEDDVVRQTRAGTACGVCRDQLADLVTASRRGGCGKSPACPGCTAHA